MPHLRAGTKLIPNGVALAGAASTGRSLEFNLLLAATALGLLLAGPGHASAHEVWSGGSSADSAGSSLHDGGRQCGSRSC